MAIRGNNPGLMGNGGMAYGSTGLSPPMQRTVLAHSFGGYNPSTSMINESDLLDLETMRGGGGQQQQQHGQGMDMYGAQQQQSLPGGFSRTPARPITLGTTPPVPESTSPFQNFLFNQDPNELRMKLATSRVQGGPQQQTTGQQAQQPQQGAAGGVPPQQQQQQPQQQGGGGSARPPSYTSPGPVARILNENGLYGSSATSTPFGSYDYAVSGSSKGKNSPQSSEDKTQILMAERRRRRRESHNAVERRRRDNINEKIKELADLVPASFLHAGLDVPKDEKPNKGTILSRSVDYIRQLQQIIDKQNMAERELQDQIRRLQREHGLKETEFKTTSAETALREAEAAGASATAASLSPDVKSPESGGSFGGVRPEIAAQMQSTKNSSSADTPSFDPEFDMDYYNIGNYNPANESAIADDDFAV